MVIWPLVPTPALLPCRGYARDTLEREEAGGVRLVWRSRLLAGRPAQQGRWTESPRAPGRIRDSRDGDGRLPAYRPESTNAAQRHARVGVPSLEYFQNVPCDVSDLDNAVYTRNLIKSVETQLMIN